MRGGIGAAGGSSATELGFEWLVGDLYGVLGDVDFEKLVTERGLCSSWELSEP